MIAAPGAWAASVLDAKYGGSSFNASAGPYGPASARGDRTASEFPAGAGPAGGGGGLAASPTTTLTPAGQRIYDYVSAHRDGASYLLAVGSWQEAGQYIMATGQEVMDMGGFSGSVPEPALGQVKHLVRGHRGGHRHAVRVQSEGLTAVTGTPPERVFVPRACAVTGHFGLPRLCAGVPLTVAVLTLTRHWPAAVRRLA